MISIICLAMCLTHSHALSFTHSLMLLFILSLPRALIHSLTPSCSHSLAHALIHSLTRTPSLCPPLSLTLAHSSAAAANMKAKDIIRSVVGL
jgi:hypothetical protein